MLISKIPIIYNILVGMGAKIFQKFPGTSMGTNCVSLLADPFLYFFSLQAKGLIMVIQL
jgi:hypothetical protein